MNRCRSAYPPLLVTPGKVIADLHAYIDCTRFEMYVRAWMLNESGMTLADLHAPITLKVQIRLTIPQYVAHHSVYISYSVCTYYIIHYPPPVYALCKPSKSITTLEPVGLRQATGDIPVTPVSTVTPMQLRVGHVCM